jgi:hypothetical protein
VRPHGTYQRYNTGCRCDDCRQAKNAYHRANRARGKDPRRFPFAPLDALFLERLGPPVQIGNPEGRGAHHSEGATDKAIGAALGIRDYQVRTLRRRGWLTSTQADHAAVALGLHPALVWDGWYADEPQEVGAS